MTLTKTVFENIVGKGEKAGHQHGLLFPVFSTKLQERYIIWAIFGFYAPALIDGFWPFHLSIRQYVLL